MEVKDKLIWLFEKHYITYTEMTQSQVKDYMKCWFENIVPFEKQKDAFKHCFPTKNFMSYLWHAFSYKYVPYINGKDAKRTFDSIKHDEAVVILNFEHIGFTLDNADYISSDELDDFSDIIITGKNFDWVYVHTHEPYCGPYFYKKSM